MVTYFQYEKTEEKYWIGKHLEDQMIKKILPIDEFLYLGYELLFLFNNATSHTIYVSDGIQVAYMNKKSGDQLIFLRLRWCIGPNQEVIIQKCQRLLEILQ